MTGTVEWAWSIHHWMIFVAVDTPLYEAGNRRPYFL